MSACGSGKSSKGGGSKSRSKGGKGDALHKKVSLQTSKEHLTTLRQALRDELGHDRDVVPARRVASTTGTTSHSISTSAPAAPSRTDLSGLTSSSARTSARWGTSGPRRYGRSLRSVQRYALVTERILRPAAEEARIKTKGKKKTPAPPLGKPVAFAHFRFTVQGETRRPWKESLCS